MPDVEVFARLMSHRAKSIQEDNRYETNHYCPENDLNE